MPTRFGMEAKLAKWKGARVGDHVLPQMVAYIGEEYTPRALRTLQTFTEERGETVLRCTQPRTIISVEPSGLKIDLMTDLADDVEAQTWMATNFNEIKFRLQSQAAIKLACDEWAKQNWDTHFRATQAGIERLASRPSN